MIIILDIKLTTQNEANSNLFWQKILQIRINSHQLHECFEIINLQFES